MRSVDRVAAIAGVGLEGDRYATGTGHYSATAKVDRARHADRGRGDRGARDGAGIVLRDRRDAAATSTLRGIRLNDLVGRRFRIGAVECEGRAGCASRAST